MTENELIDCILDHNNNCFKILVDKYQSLILNTCFGFLKYKSDAEDVTQEVFIEIYHSIYKFNRKSSLSTWIYRISVNKSLDYIRNNKKRNIFISIEKFIFNISDDSIDTISNNIQDEKEAILHITINRLSKNQKIAFTLHKFRNLSYKEIAEIMELSLSAVEGLIHRANKNVRKELLNYYKKK